MGSGIRKYCPIEGKRLLKTGVCPQCGWSYAKEHGGQKTLFKAKVQGDKK